jgi:hypothetical protein
MLPVSLETRSLRVAGVIPARPPCSKHSPACHATRYTAPAMRPPPTRLLNSPPARATPHSAKLLLDAETGLALRAI